MMVRKEAEIEMPNSHIAVPSFSVLCSTAENTEVVLFCNSLITCYEQYVVQYFLTSVYTITRYIATTVGHDFIKDGNDIADILRQYTVLETEAGCSTTALCLFPQGQGLYIPDWWVSLSWHEATTNFSS